uniref:Uncharacterized protein n=1 Tax=Cacopsylla melanoneura TaxID=428564 RepID=A0A8D8TUP7_9HEMI
MMRYSRLEQRLGLVEGFNFARNLFHAAHNFFRRLINLLNSGRVVPQIRPSTLEHSRHASANHCFIVGKTDLHPDVALVVGRGHEFGGIELYLGFDEGNNLLT